MTVLSRSHENRLLILLALTQFTIIMDFMVMMPLGPQIMQALNISPAGFATAVSVYSWCGGLSGLFAATYIDRFDRRRLMLVVYGLFVLSNLGCALSGSYSLLLMARAFAGITGGVLGSVVMTIVSDVIPSERRGMATGTIMMAFSLAAVGGVPLGVVLGAHFRWEAPFFLLTGLSGLMVAAAWVMVPSLRDHLSKVQPAWRNVLPDLWHLLTNPVHMKSFAVTFTLMVSQMMVIPFISPVMVANYGIEPVNIAWIYVAGGASTFITSRLVGKLADKFPRQWVFRGMVGVSVIPVLILTHLPHWPFWAMIAFFPIFMVFVSGRIIPLNALQSTVPVPAHRGAFLSANNAVQALGTGTGAWFGGLFLTTIGGAAGPVEGYGTVGIVAVTLALIAALMVGWVKPYQPA